MIAERDSRDGRDKGRFEVRGFQNVEHRTSHVGLCLIRYSCHLTRRAFPASRASLAYLARHAPRSVEPTGFFSILLACIIHEGSSRKRADAKRDGHAET